MNSFGSSLRGLFTHEDPFHLHKTVGIAVLASFVWRLSDFDPENDLKFASHPTYTLPTVLLHTALHVTSFVFRIPARRMRTKNSRIWPEYRLHTAVFSGRSLVCILLNHFDRGGDTYDIRSVYGHASTRVRPWRNYIVVMATLATADIVSVSVAHRSNSIRDLDATPVFVRFFFSAMQFIATTCALIRHRGASSVFFYNMFVVQLTAFTMTLQRKNVLSHGATVTVYGLQLAYGFWLGLSFVLRDAGVIRLTASIAVYLRIGWRMNKYIVWTICFALWQLVWVESMDEDFPEDEKLLRRKNMVTLADVATMSIILWGLGEQAMASFRRRSSSFLVAKNEKTESNSNKVKGQ